MELISASGIRKVFDLAKSLKDPVNLSIGQPDFDIPEELKEEAIKWIKDGFNNYTPTQGIPELIEAVNGKIKDSTGRTFEDTMITSGTSGGLILACLVLINPGDEVIFPDPYFVMYKHLVNLTGGVPVIVDTYPDFKLSAEKLEQAITPKTKIIILNTPANPTGAVYSDEEIQAIAQVAKRHNVLVIADEIYENFCYDAPFSSICKYYDNVLLLNGFSKSHAMTGWRVGYASGSRQIIQEMAKLQQFSFVCAPSFAQKAAVKAFDINVDKTLAEYKVKRDLIYNGLKDKFEVEKPGGAFYIFPKAPGGDATKFVEKAIKNNLLIIPGSVFSDKDTHFRISFAASNETINRGIEILNSLV